MLRRAFLKNGLKVAGVASAAPGALTGALAEGLAAGEDAGAKPLQEFGYGDVELAPGRMRTQFEETRAVLLGMDEDALLRPWRLRAGLSAPGGPMGGWYDEVPLVKTPSGGEGFAPGHSFGQWISALARGVAVDGDPESKAKLRRILDLYGPAISGKFYDNFRFPAYNYDKMVIGLIDAHQFAGVPDAFDLLNRTTDAAEPHLPPTALDRDAPQIAWRTATGQNSTGDYGWDESYTLPENLYLAAQRGAGERYRTMAPRYLLDKSYFDPLSENRNVLPDHHAYSFCNALSSAMQAYMVGGSEKHLRAARNAHEMIVATQSYATGGWGPDESFREPNTGALYASLTKTKHSFETPCGSYAHFKLTRYLLRVTRDGRYGDSMERVLYNTVLGAKSLQKDGRAFYYSDYSDSATKFYFDDAWPCCSGTLPQVAADYHILGYFRDDDGVWVNLYMPSTLKWTGSHGARMSLTQAGGYPLEGNVALVVKASKAEEFALRLRIPAWAGQDGLGGQVAEIKVNGLAVNAAVDKGFATLRRKWKDGDRVELMLPLPMRLEAIDGAGTKNPDTVALVRGPLVLFALTEDAPKVSRAQLLAAKAMKGQAVWMADTSSGPLLLTPFTEIHEERYRTYLTVS
ncbi:glycoside hydrolase family 127 protein [Acidicapsa acidisoli]|uniref:glycoside hydrolase family 127 protein n=1 Tax=Acidicapsa acidisoli TaxID=1615681 RepID=UPI0021E02870|nr:glycoside hydrolase family 127 protein [Acidicapsa acidisoli]